MAEMITEKYIRTGATRPSNHPEVTAPIIILKRVRNVRVASLRGGFFMKWLPKKKARHFYSWRAFFVSLTVD